MKYVRRFLTVVIALMLLSAVGMMLQQRNIIPLGRPAPTASVTPAPTPEATPAPTACT